jgi:hypothetical protein
MNTSFGLLACALWIALTMRSRCAIPFSMSPFSSQMIAHPMAPTMASILSGSERSSFSSRFA